MAIYNIIGFGYKTKKIIDILTEKCKYQEISIKMALSSTDISFENDKMTILVVADDYVEAAIECAKQYYNRDILTLIFSTHDNPLFYDCADSVAIMPNYDMIVTITDIMKSILLPGINSFDFYDIYNTLHKSRHFIAINGFGNDIQTAYHDWAKKRFSGYAAIAENISILIFINKGRAISKEDLIPLSEYESSVMPEAIVRIGIFHDNDIKEDEVRISIIGSGNSTLFKTTVRKFIHHLRSI